MGAEIDFHALAQSYFWFDKPVPYKLSKDKEINIFPVKVEDSEMFLSWIDLISIDKNALGNPEYISMSYLEFLFKCLLISPNEELSSLCKIKLVSILKLCLGWEGEIKIILDEKNKPKLVNKDTEINGKKFEDIRRIILYQNLLDFDDEYINPDVKQAIKEMNELKNKNIDYPSIERKMAIVTAHTGISKAEQMKMTYRSHTALFKEVYGEVDFSTARTAIMVGNMFSKQKINVEDWIYKNKHNKYEQFFTTEQSYQKSMGGGDSVRMSVTNSSDIPNIDLISFSN